MYVHTSQNWLLVKLDLGPPPPSTLRVAVGVNGVYPSMWELKMANGPRWATKSWIFENTKYGCIDLARRPYVKHLKMTIWTSVLWKLLILWAKNCQVLNKFFFSLWHIAPSFNWIPINQVGQAVQAAQTPGGQKKTENILGPIVEVKWAMWWKKHV